MLVIFRSYKCTNPSLLSIPGLPVCLGLPPSHSLAPFSFTLHSSLLLFLNIITHILSPSGPFAISLFHLFFPPHVLMCSSGSLSLVSSARPGYILQIPVTYGPHSSPSAERPHASSSSLARLTPSQCSTARSGPPPPPPPPQRPGSLQHSIVLAGLSGLYTVQSIHQGP